MKKKLSLLILAAVLFAACAKRKFYNSIEGKWTTYELIDGNGNDLNSSIEAFSIFGIYDPHISFKEDKSYVPLARNAEGQLEPQPDGEGRYKFDSKSRKLLLTGGQTDLEFHVDKLKDDELWLTSLSQNKDARIKLKRN